MKSHRFRFAKITTIHVVFSARTFHLERQHFRNFEL